MEFGLFFGLLNNIMPVAVAWVCSRAGNETERAPFVKNEESVGELLFPLHSPSLVGAELSVLRKSGQKSRAALSGSPGCLSAFFLQVIKWETSKGLA